MTNEINEINKNEIVGFVKSTNNRPIKILDDAMEKNEEKFIRCATNGALSSLQYQIRNLIIQRGLSKNWKSHTTSVIIRTQQNGIDVDTNERVVWLEKLE